MEAMAVFSMHMSPSRETKAMSEWQDIASAPKDGTPILIFVPGSAQEVKEAWWALQYEGGPGYWSTPTGPAGRGYVILPEAPTHWMPLPEPPK
jgi:hypothetical protein